MKYTLSLFSIILLSFSASAQIPAPIWKINTIAGNGLVGFNNDGFVATGAALNAPIGVDLDSFGNYYILDMDNNRIRKVGSGNIISTVAGNGLPGNTGDNSIATSATISPRGMAISKLGDIYIADQSVSVVRKVDHITGIITRYAGNATYGFSGDGGNALSAQMRTPYGMTLAPNGDLYIADVGNHAVRKVVAATGKIYTVAGIDTAGYSGDLGLAVNAKLDSPYAVALDVIGNLYISDHRNNVIRKVDTAGIITTYAGMYNTYGHTGDGGPAASATLNAPKGITLDSLGNLYICDADNFVIRKVDTSKKISTIVGVGNQGFAGDLSLAINALLDNPYDIAVDKWGSLYIADANNQRIRKVYNALLSVSTVNKNNIEMYPNPVKGYVTISGLTRADKVAIFDMAGRQVNDWSVTTEGTQSFSINTLATGTYILQVTDEAGNRKSSMHLVKE